MVVHADAVAARAVVEVALMTVSNRRVTVRRTSSLIIAGTFEASMLLRGPGTLTWCTVCGRQPLLTNVRSMSC